MWSTSPVRIATAPTRRSWEDAAFKDVSKMAPVDMQRMFTGGFKVLRGI